MLGAFQDISFGRLVLMIALATIISMAVFNHATKNGSKHPTAWGVAVFLATPLVVVYFTHHFLTRRR